MKIIGKVFLGAAYYSGLVFPIEKMLSRKDEYLILIYHKVSDDGWEFSIPPKIFERQLEFIKSNFSVVSLGSLKSPQDFKRRKIIITFDDGWEDNYSIAFGMIKKFNIPVHIFLITGRVGKEGYLNWQQINEMKESGLVHFENHTMSHAKLSEVSDGTILQEIKSASKELEKHVGKSRILSYPFGDRFNEKTISILKKLKFEYGLSWVPGINNKDTDPFKLKRVSINTSDIYTKFKLMCPNLFFKFKKDPVMPKNHDFKDGMRLVLISWGYLEYVLSLANELSQKNKVCLILPDSMKSYADSKKSQNLEIFYFKHRRMRNPLNMLSALSIVKKTNSFKPDVIHIQDGNPYFSFVMPKLNSQRIVTTIHDPKQHLGEEKFWETIRDKITRKFTKRYIVHGEFLKGQLNSELKVPSNIIEILPHGNFNIILNSKNKKMQKPDKKTKTPKILFFGRIWPYKGLDVLIKSEPVVSQKIKDFKIIIAGTGENFEKYEKLIKDKSKFEIMNYRVENEKVPSLFYDSDAVVLPYLEATQSGVAVLAFSMGKCVIATKVGSIPEMVDDGINGVLVEPRNEVALGEAIARLLKDKNLRKKLSANAYKKANKELSWKTVAEKTIGVYKKCLI